MLIISIYKMQHFYTHRVEADCKKHILHRPLQQNRHSSVYGR